ncbi:MAG: glycosyltransferase family 2 protein [Flavobacteriaceae bacterium]|jgi:glycosyltransferase involved in cell wall biosynthesis|nr:glycosyltransferase family 2 protein [Flavobacteriaceae bacterium]
MNGKEIEVSVIVPVYNEDKTLVAILEKINQQSIAGIKIEIIIINDGSTDNSLKILKEHSSLFHKLINLEKNSGKGAAVREGLKLATGDYILFQDADMEYDPSEYTKLLEPIIKQNADIVIGSRLMTSSLTRSGGYSKNRIGNNFITWLFNLLNHTTFTDIYSGYLIFRRSNIVPNKLRTDGWEQQAEILSKIVKNSTKIYDVPIAYYGRSYEEGKKIKPKDVFNIIFTIIGEKISPSKN